MADIPQITEKVKEIIVKHLAVNADQVVPEARFIEDLNADSLDTVELVMEFEETFDMKIPDDVVENMLTVGAAIDYIAKQLDAKAAAGEEKQA
ncbi:MAG: acyl carrier protein [Victivallales bacterium]|nr:acyl carrier protein [Victivallales bacterium]